MDNWYVPITLLPAVGFFIVAATSIANSLSGEIARLLELEGEDQMDIVSKKLRQLRLVNVSLVLLYNAAILIAVSGLFAGLRFNFMVNVKGFIEVLVCLGITTIVIAFVMLMVYSMRAVSIKEEQFKNRL